MAAAKTDSCQPGNDGLVGGADDASIVHYLLITARLWALFITSRALKGKTMNNNNNHTSIAHTVQIVRHAAHRHSMGLLTLALCCGLTISPAMANPLTVLIGEGDSLTQGTMDASNNAINSKNAYLQKVAESVAKVMPIIFTQPWLDAAGNRILPFLPATNLGVDGADIFSAEGLEYYKRAGVPYSYLTADFLCDKYLPGDLQDKYDKVLYPLSYVARRPVSQMDGLELWLGQVAGSLVESRGLVVFWLGNNDSSTAALGNGGLNPAFLPIPFEQIKDKVSPVLSLLLQLGEAAGAVSFASYTQSTVERNLTELSDFAVQYNHLLDRIQVAQGGGSSLPEIFLITLPYYSSVGYLMDASDLEFYLRKIDPAYSVPATFQRPQSPSTGPVNGDRISLLTFGMMYLLLNSGHTVAEVNEVLEQNGVQRDEVVLSESEQNIIVARIDAFNDVIKSAAAARGASFHLVDVGQVLNEILGGPGMIIDGLNFNRRWGRGNAFTLDGVHPNYTGHALIANEVIKAINATYGVSAAEYNLAEVAAGDPYVDRDGDGWVPGSALVEPGIAELLAFFRDPDDADANTEVDLPADIWQQVSDILLREILDIEQMQTIAAQSEMAEQLPEER